MPDAAVATAPAPAPDAAVAPTDATPGLTGPLGAIQKADRDAARVAANQMATAQTAHDRLEANTAETQKNVQAALDYHLDPPTLDHMPQMEEITPTSAVQAWSSGAMMLTAIGSLFTRRPLATAMKSAAAALNAFRQGDQDKANYAYQKWKVDTENYWKVKNYEFETYKAIIGDHMDRAKMAAEMGSQKEQAILSEVQAFASAYGNEFVAAQRTGEDLLRAMEFDSNQTLKMAMAQEKLDTEQIFQSDMSAFYKERGWKESVGPQGQQIVTHDDGTPLDENETQQRTQYASTLLGKLNHSWSPGQEANYIKSSAQLTAKSALGTSFTSVMKNYDTVMRFPPGGGVVDQATLTDAYNQIINGGRAIRAYQQTMLTHDAGLLDRLQATVGQIIGKGGPLSPRMIADIKEATRELAHGRVMEMRDAISQGDDALSSLGLDTSTYEHEVFMQTGTPRIPGWNAPDEAVRKLQEHIGKPDEAAVRQYFDNKYGGVGASEYWFPTE